MALSLAANSTGDISGMVLQQKEVYGVAPATNFLSAQDIARLIPGGDLAGDWFGEEYLFSCRNSMATNGPLKIGLAGDSTMLGNNVNQQFLPQTILSNVLSSRYCGTLAVTNYSVSGIDTLGWLTNGYETNFMALSNNLVVLWFGFNNSTDPLFVTNYDLMLSTFRSKYAVSQVSGILLSAQSASDDQHGRGVSSAMLNNVAVRKLARKYGFAYLDARALTLDAWTNEYSLYDHPYTNELGGIHGNDRIKEIIFNQLAEKILPKSLADQLAPPNCFSRTFGNKIVPPAAAMPTAKAAWFGANVALGSTFYVTVPTFVNQAHFFCGTNSGNIAIQVSSNICNGTFCLTNGVFVRLTWTGVIPCPAPQVNGLCTVNFPGVVLQPGAYSISFWCDNTTLVIPNAYQDSVRALGCWEMNQTINNMTNNFLSFTPTTGDSRYCCIVLSGGY